VRLFREEKIDGEVVKTPAHRLEAGDLSDLFNSYCDFCESRNIPRHTSLRRFLHVLEQETDVKVQEVI
jgi:hypothetical protein